MSRSKPRDDTWEGWSPEQIAVTLLDCPSHHDATVKEPDDPDGMMAGKESIVICCLCVERLRALAAGET